MAPVAATLTTETTSLGLSKASANNSFSREPMKLTGILDQFKSIDSTPVIGREYPTIQIRDLLNAPNSDELLRELAIISE